MKQLLLIPFLALLGTSCSAPHYVTTPTLNAPQAQAFTPTRKTLANASAVIDHEENAYNFNVSINDDGTSNIYYDFRTGETGTSYTNLKNKVGNYVGVRLFTTGGVRKLSFICYNPITSGDQLIAGQSGSYGLETHLPTLNYQGLTQETTRFYLVDQSIINISGFAIVNEYFYEGYTEGHYDGYEEGLEDGVNEGLTNGREEGYTSGYSEGYENGLEASRNAENLTIGNYYTTITLFPDFHQAVEIAKTLTQDGGTGLVSWAYGSWKLLFQAVDFPAGSVPFPNAKNLTLSFVFDTENVGLKVYSGLGTLGVASTQVGYIDLQNLRAGRYGSSWLYSFDPLTWGWNTPDSTNGEEKVYYTGNPLNISIRFGDDYYNKAWKFYQYQLGASQTFDQYNAEECTRALLGGAGTSYADGFANGNEQQIKAQSTYRNVFKIFTPAFTAVGSFFNMSIGPFKMWYFFVIPLMITALVLFIKLVKH